MGTKHVRLDEDVYAKIAARKREDETFSEAVDRLTTDWSITDFSAGFDGDTVEEWREAVETIEATTRENTKGNLDRLDTDADDR